MIFFLFLPNIQILAGSINSLSFPSLYNSEYLRSRTEYQKVRVENFTFRQLRISRAVERSQVRSIEEFCCWSAKEIPSIKARKLMGEVNLEITILQSWMETIV